MAEIVNNMQSLSPAEYAAASEEERMIDSIFVMALLNFQQLGGTDEMLSQYEVFESIDLDRSKSMYDKYMAEHPESMGDGM